MQASSPRQRPNDSCGRFGLGNAAGQAGPRDWQIALMIRAPEIKSLILDWYRSIAFGEIVGSGERILSERAGFRTIGSDPTELMEDRDSLIRAYSQTARTGALNIKVTRIRAFSEGTVGWAVGGACLACSRGVEWGRSCPLLPGSLE